MECLKVKMLKKSKDLHIMYLHIAKDTFINGSQNLDVIYNILKLGTIFVKNKLNYNLSSCCRSIIIKLNE